MTPSTKKKAPSKGANRNNDYKAREMQLSAKSGKGYANEAIAEDRDCKNEAETVEYARMMIQGSMTIYEEWITEIMNFETRDRRTKRSLVMAETLL